MPARSNWKSQLDRDLIRLQHGTAEGLKNYSKTLLSVARADGILEGGTERSRNGRKLIYKETAQTNRYSQRKEKRYGKNGVYVYQYPPRRVFNNTKYMSRTGKLKESLALMGGFAGNIALTHRDGKITVDQGTRTVKIEFTGQAEAKLKGGDSKNARVKTEIQLGGGTSVTQGASGRRRIIELANRKVSRQWVKIMKGEIDRSTRDWGR